MIPKNACSSIRHLILKQIFEKDDIKYKIAKLQVLPKIDYSELGKYENYLWFVFLRDPFKRLISCYKDKVLGQPGDQIYKPLYNPSMTFRSFVDYVCGTNDYYIDWHLKSQCYFVDGYMENMDFIGFVEDFDKDIKLLKFKINCKYKHDHLRKTSQSNNKYFLDNDNIRNKIKQRYRNDFELIKKVKQGGLNEV